MVQCQLATLSFARLGVPDIAEAVRFWTEVAGFTCVERRSDSAALSVGDDKISLVLTSDGAVGMQELGYAVDSQTELDCLRKTLADNGYPTEVGRRTYLDGDVYAFRDPDGFPLALSVRPSASAEVAKLEETTSRPILKILHPLFVVADRNRSEDFYTRLLGFRVSDYIGDRAVFMRCRDQYHHSFALMQGSAAGTVEHIAFLVKDIDVVMRTRNKLWKLGNIECADVIRHGGSGSIAVYFRDPASGVQIEYCTAHGKITDPAHTPRVLPAAPTSFDIWQDF